MNDPWISRILDSECFERLAAGLPNTTLQSVLLEVVRRRARRRSPADVLAHFGRDSLCRPAAIDQRTSLAIDAEFFAAAEPFEALELAPVAPLAACSSVALTDQNRVLSALRSTEVVDDPTNVLALECALRLRASPNVALNLATSQRIVRTQPVPDIPGYAPHFRMFALASAGIESSGNGFTRSALVMHVQTMLRALYGLEGRGYSFHDRRLEVFASRACATLGDLVASALGHVVTRREHEHPYYKGGLRYVISATASDGQHVPVIDGGAFDWVAKLASNHRAVYIASAAGTQVIASRFRSK